MNAHLSRHARRYLGTAGLTSVIAIVTMGTDLPGWAQTAILCIVAVLHALWTLAPDADGDRIPDWLEANAPDVAKAIEHARADGREAKLGAMLNRVASAIVRREVGADDTEARSPVWAAVLALIVTHVAACAAPTVILRAEGSGAVSLGVEKAPPLVVEHDAGVSVLWPLDSWPPDVTVDDPANCARVSWLAYRWESPGCSEPVE